MALATTLFCTVGLARLGNTSLPQAFRMLAAALGKQAVQEVPWVFFRWDWSSWTEGIFSRTVLPTYILIPLNFNVLMSDISGVGNGR